MKAAFEFDPRTRCTVADTNRFATDLRVCLALGPKRRFRGIFISEFEGDRFLEGATPAATYRPQDEVSFVTDSRSDFSAAPILAERRDARYRIFEVEVEGRLARNADNSEIGLFDEILFVDRVTSARLIREFPGYVPAEVLVR